MDICHYCRKQINETTLIPVDYGQRACVCDDCDAERIQILKDEQLNHLADSVYIRYEGPDIVLLPVDAPTRKQIGKGGLSFSAP